MGETLPQHSSDGCSLGVLFSALPKARNQCQLWHTMRWAIIPLGDLGPLADRFNLAEQFFLLEVGGECSGGE